MSAGESEATDDGAVPRRRWMGRESHGTESLSPQPRRGLGRKPGLRGIPGDLEGPAPPGESPTALFRGADGLPHPWFGGRAWETNWAGLSRRPPNPVRDPRADPRRFNTGSRRLTSASVSAASATDCFTPPSREGQADAAAQGRLGLAGATGRPEAAREPPPRTERLFFHPPEPPRNHELLVRGDGSFWAWRVAQGTGRGGAGRRVPGLLLPPARPHSLVRWPIRAFQDD